MEDDDGREIYAGPLWLAIAVVFLLAGFLIGWFAKPSDAAVMPTIDNAIVLIADISASMDDDEKRIVRESHALAMSSPEVINAILSGDIGRSAFAYVEFGDRAELVVEWTVIATGDDALNFASVIWERSEHPVDLGPSTSIGSALALSAELMRSLPETPLFRTVDVAGDGISNGLTWVPFRDELLEMGVTINGLPMLLRADDKDLAVWYAERLIGGPRAFSLELRDISDMPMLVRRKLTQELY